MLGPGWAALLDLGTSSQPGMTHTPTLEDGWHRGPCSPSQPWARSQGTLAQPQEKDLHGMGVHRTRKRGWPPSPSLSGDTENGAPVPLSFWQRPQWGSSNPLAVTRPLHRGSGATMKGLQGAQHKVHGGLGTSPQLSLP